MSVYTVDEVAKLLRLNPQTIYRAVWDKRINAIKVGRQLRITSQALRCYVGEEAYDEIFGNEKRAQGVDFDANPLLQVEDWAMDAGISDLARNHDYYLYGADRK